MDAKSKEISSTDLRLQQALEAEQQARREAEQQTLKAFDCCSHTEVQLDRLADDQGSCKLLATLGDDYSHAVDDLLSAAKEGIFSRTSRSRGVCLIGYRRTPFMFTPEGFSCKLGTVAGRREACRQFYAEGQCKYMDTCYLKHPSTTVYLNVVVTNQKVEPVSRLFWPVPAMQSQEQPLARGERPP